MSMTDAVHPARSIVPAGSVSYETFAVVGVIAIALTGRLASGWGAPLWFDETFSAVIANQPDVSSLVDWCINEIGGPVYYVLLWLWARLFGGDATTLRALSLLCSIGAPVVAWRLGPRVMGLNRYWAALLALWTPIFDYASNARCYGLLFLVLTLQSIAFLRLLRSPTRRRATAWTTMSALGVLTHYQVAVLAGVQGVMFLVMHRKAALRCWPALLPLMPMVGWIWLHLPILLRFSSAGSWYPRITPVDLLIAPANFFDSGMIGIVLALGWAVAAIARRNGWRTDPIADAHWPVAASGLIAIAFLLLGSMIKPSFTWRYAVVGAPAILFGVALWAQSLRPRLALAPLAILCMFAGSAIGRIASFFEYPATNYRYAFNLDRPSNWLVGANPQRLGFLWDSPTGTMSDPRRLAEVAGYFPRRVGRPVAVSVLKVWPGSDPRRMVHDQAAGHAIDSLIWISDASIPGTLASTDAGMLVRQGWACRDFGRFPISVLACRAHRS